MRGTIKSSHCLTGRLSSTNAYTMLTARAKNIVVERVLERVLVRVKHRIRSETFGKTVYGNICKILSKTLSTERLGDALNIFDSFCIAKYQNYDRLKLSVRYSRAIYIFKAKSLHSVVLAHNLS